jgi:hypothetical protein
MIYTLQRKAQIFHQGNGNCLICDKVGNLKHYLNWCINQGTEMIQRPDKEGKVLVQAIHVHISQNIIRSHIENSIYWNKRIKLLQEIQKIRQEIRNLEEKVSKIRPDIWFYKIEKNNVKGKIRKSLVLKLVEITIP